MKNKLILFITIISLLSCKAQTVLTLGDGQQGNINNLSKPIFTKDLNNLRNNFYGVWQGISGNSELTIYLYKIDDIPIGILGNQGQSYIDQLFGYYIYKENGVEITNCISEANLNQEPLNIKHSPFFGITANTESLQLRFKDYGIQIQNPDDGSFFAKRARASFSITNLNSGNSLQANFELKNIQGAGQMVVTGNTPIQDYNYNFSMPTNFTLTKIANIPPALN